MTQEELDRIKAALDYLEDRVSLVLLGKPVRDLDEAFCHLRSLLSAPSPVGQEARELARQLQELHPSRNTRSWVDEAASLIQSALDAAVARERELVVEKCKKAIYPVMPSDGFFLDACKKLDAIKEAKE